MVDFADFPQYLLKQFRIESVSDEKGNRLFLIKKKEKIIYSKGEI